MNIKIPVSDIILQTFYEVNRIILSKNVAKNADASNDFAVCLMVYHIHSTNINIGSRNFAGLHILCKNICRLAA